MLKKTDLQKNKNLPQTEIVKYILDSLSKPEILKPISNTVSDVAINKIDSLKMFELRLKQLEYKTNNIQSCLKYCHSQFKTGTTFIVIGLCAEVLGTAMLLTKSEFHTLGQGLTFCGGVVVFTGWIFQIDSHRYIGSAGK